MFILCCVTGVLYLPSQVQRQRRGEAVAMFPHVSPQVCGSMAQDYILLSTLQTRTGEIETKKANTRAEKALLFFIIFFPSVHYGVIYFICIRYIHKGYLSEFIVLYSGYSPVTNFFSFWLKFLYCFWEYV